MSTGARTLASARDAAEADVVAWVGQRRKAHRFSVRQVPLDALEDWRVDPETGNLRHATGRFFSVEGLRVRASYPAAAIFHQPIVNQPEIGILGILAKRFAGELRFLMQAKMEPGNVNLVQLSPTVQATRSNYTQAHGGSRVRYLEYFQDRRRSRVLADQLQSEQGAFFLRKRNRNIIVETSEDVAAHEDFCWLTLAQLKRALKADNLVNMDTRTVLSAIPLTGGAQWGPATRPPAGGFAAALVESARARNRGELGDEEILSWLTELKSTAQIEVQTLPLNRLPGWKRDALSIRRDDGRYFEVIGISVEADSREVGGWCQPIVRPCETGIAGFLVQERRGVLHFLVQARMEPGIFDILELGPTVQHVPGMDNPVPFLEYFERAVPDRVRHASLQSEEGGRFYHYQNRNMIVELPASDSLEAPFGYAWMTLGQIHELLRYNNYLNVEARGLIACLNAGDARQ